MFPQTARQQTEGAVCEARMYCNVSPRLFAPKPRQYSWCCDDEGGGVSGLSEVLGAGEREAVKRTPRRHSC